MPWSKLDDEFYDHPKVVEAIDSGARVCYYDSAVRHGAAVRAPMNRGTIGLAERVLVPLSMPGRSIWRQRCA